MFLRIYASALLLLGAASAYSQEAFNTGMPNQPGAAIGKPPEADSAWLDLRQDGAANARPQTAPSWVESVTLVPVPAHEDAPARTIFRIRVTHPRTELQLMLVRLFFDDKPEKRPSITAWDESGTQVLQSGALGAGIDLQSSDTVTLPMIGVSCLDIEVPGDGTTVRGVYLDWMISREVAHPLGAEARDVLPEPFSATAPLHTPEQDFEQFGTVTATLAAEPIRIGAGVQTGAAFQFGLEAQPLAALLSFEVSTPWVDSPPEVYVNGESIGPVAMALPDLADPGYRGETERLVSPMRFIYTGWIRAQKLVPAASLRVGTNDILVIGGPGTPASAIRATQIQLKYLWDKSDYSLQVVP